jgi:hypothetical protein
MSQNATPTIDPDVMGGTGLAAWLEAFKPNVYSNHRGSGRPTYAVAGMIWSKSVSSSVEEVYYDDGTQGILIGTFNPTDHTWLAQILKSNDPGSGYGPDLLLDRASASPAALDELGAIRWAMRNASAAQVVAALIEAQILDPTAASEDSQLLFKTLVAGAFATRMTLNHGLVIGSPSGGDQGAGSLNLQSLYIDGAAVQTSGQKVPSRQTVLSGPVNNDGAPNFGGSTGSTSVTASGTLIVTAANGADASGAVDRVGSITNPQWTGLNANGTRYLYLDVAANGVCTPGHTALAPTYRPGGADVVTNGQFTFNIQQMVGKVGNGSVATQTYRVFVGEVTISGSVVTAIKWYAVQGRYISPWTATLPGTSTSVSFSHDIGTNEILGAPELEAECTTADNGYAIGDRLTGPLNNYNGSVSTPELTITGRNTMQFATGGFGWSMPPKGGGNSAALTVGSWKYRSKLNRGW